MLGRAHAYPVRSKFCGVLCPAPVGLLTRAAGRTLIRLAILGILVLAATGCGSSPRNTIPAPVATTAAYGPNPYSNATAERNKLLGLAKPGTKVTSQGNLPGWPPANGSAIPASATEVSGFGFNVDKVLKVQYLSFAVSDTNHSCAGGDIIANAKGTTVVSSRAVKLPSHAPCTGDEVAKLAGHG